MVKSTLWGPNGHTKLNLALDTGSAHTLVLPEIMDSLGFNPGDGLAITDVYSAIGKEQGYVIKAPKFSALGFTRTGFLIHVFDLAECSGIDGLLGLSFLHHYNYTVRSTEGLILVEEAADALQG
jgi:predicted aspartyl protease